MSNLPEMIIHTVARTGKTVAGFVVDLSEEEAKAIDPYTFKKNDGWFIRARHIEELKVIYGVEK